MTIPAPAPTDATSAAAKQKNPVGLAALIVGAVAFVFAIIPFLSLIAWLPALAAIVLGIIGIVKKNRARGLAWTGLGLGIVSWIIAVAVSVATFAGAASSISESIESASPVAPSAATTEVAPTASEEPAVVETPTETAAPAAPTPTEPALTLGQQNAISKGKSYLSYTAFSRSGLIEQLEYEGFATADAEFAVDRIAPDWNAQAAAKAKSYLEYSSFSRDGLIEQLVYEGFTQEQAESGAAAVGY